MTLERLWAGWRSDYVGSASGAEADRGCVFCRILASEEPPEQTYLLWRDDTCAAVLNAFPYTSGHVMVAPYEHTADLTGLDQATSLELMALTQDSLRSQVGTSMCTACPGGKATRTS